MNGENSVQDLERSLENRKEWYEYVEGIHKAGKFVGKTALYSLAYLGLRNLAGAEMPGEELNSLFDYADVLATGIGVMGGLFGVVYTLLGASEKKGYRKEIEKLEKDLETVSLIKGIRGISSLMYSLLKQGKEIKIMGVRSEKKSSYNNFWRGWHGERLNLKKKASIIFSDKNTDYWRFFKKMKHTEVREILHFSPSAMMNIDNNLLIFSYEEEITLIHVLSEPIAQSFSNYFDDLWKIADK